MKHPATFTNSFIEIFYNLLKDCDEVLDPFAGVGKLSLIKDHGFKGRIVCNELEPEWANESEYNVDEWHIGDAANMSWCQDNRFDAICTSPTYGNRMADHHNAKDNSRRITYTHYLGRKLNDQNTGKMQWGVEYREKHIKIYKECIRVLKNDGIMVVNISDHIRKGNVIPVCKWHKNTLIELGMNLINDIQIETPRMKFGRNSELRITHEHIFVFAICESRINPELL